MKLITRKLIAGVLAVALIGGTVLTAGAATALKPIAPIRPKPIITIPAKDPPATQIPLLMQMQIKLREYCAEYGVPLHIALGVIEVGSDFDMSYHGSQLGTERIGFMAVPDNTPSMFADLASTNIHDAYSNLRAGCYILGWLHERHATWAEAVLCYDIGESNAARYFIPYGETTAWARQVMAAAERWQKIVG